MIRRKKHYKFQFSRWSQKIIKSVLKPNSMILYVLWIVFVIGLFLTFNIRSRIYNSDYIISKVVFSTWSLASYNDSELFNDIIHIYSWTYYSTIRIGSTISSIIDTLVMKKWYISSIIPVSFSNNVLLVDVKFKEPMLKFYYNNMEYAIYENTFVPLSTGDQLGMKTPMISLPLYLSGTSQSISWILYNISVQKMLTDYLLLQTSPIQWTLTYIPGGEKYVIRNPNQKVYFNTKKDISKQLSLLYILKNNYNGFEDLKQIDVWSLDNPIVK